LDSVVPHTFPGTAFHGRRPVKVSKMSTVLSKARLGNLIGAEQFNDGFSLSQTSEMAFED
jgi:hypothetical protein